MPIEPLMLMAVVFIGVILIASIKNIHCPYWQLPLGVSLLSGSVILSLIASITWPEIALSWFFGAGAAILIVVTRTHKEKIK